MRIIPTFSFLFVLFNVISCQNKANENEEMASSIKLISSSVLSSNGSTRATAYVMSNKIISANGKIFVAWLDRVADIQIQSYDTATDCWGETVTIGQGVDNHSGPAITMDGHGYIHAVFGPHHGPFQYRRSMHPSDITEWEPVEHFGVSATYPSLVCDSNDMLHCAYRGGPMPRRLMYQQKPNGGAWSKPIEIVHPGVEDDYTQYHNPLLISTDGIIHLGFHIYDMHPARGKSVGYLRSRDNGRTWENSVGETMALPVTPTSPCFIEQGADLDMRFGNIAVDNQGRPWFAALHLEKRPRSATLWHLENGEWKSQDLLGVVQKAFDAVGVVQNALTFDDNNVLYIFMAILKANAPLFFGDPSTEVVLLISDDFGKTFEILPVSKPDLDLPNWLPNIERPFGPRSIGIPSLLYTHGGPGKGLTEGVGTEVIFVRLGRK